MPFTPAFWQFIDSHIADDPSKLRLKYHGKTEDFDLDLAITQIECRRKYAKKLASTLSSIPQFVFPSALAGEQSTGDVLASFHASLCPEGCRVVDLTAGLGIDALHFAQRGCQVTALDIEEAKVQALSHNAAEAGLQVHVEQADCRQWVAEYQGEPFDAAFIDPARRAADGSRVFALADCQPDVVDMLPQLRRVAHTLIVKASPMLDVTHVAKALGSTSVIYLLGSTTECKELVAVVDLDRDSADQPDGYHVNAITFTAQGEVSFAFTPAQERAAASHCQYSVPEEGCYLYEPYPAVMKAAPFFLLAVKYGLKKMHANTHLYFSEALQPGFPGEVFVIERVITYESKHIKRLKKEYPVISVGTRNFDVAADALRKKLGVKDGGDKRLIATTVEGNQPVMLVLRREAR